MNGWKRVEKNTSWKNVWMREHTPCWIACNVSLQNWSLSIEIFSDERIHFDTMSFSLNWKKETISKQDLSDYEEYIHRLDGSLLFLFDVISSLDQHFVQVDDKQISIWKIREYIWRVSFINHSP